MSTRMFVERLVGLTRHPWTEEDSVRGVEVCVRRSATGLLALSFRLEGDLTRICVPPPADSRFVTRLWERTCFESFLAAEDASAYYELNFSPSGEWAAYRFSEYRDREAVPDDRVSPQITVRTARDCLELDAVVGIDRFSDAHAIAPLRIGLSAVIEETGGRRSYWALRHPAGKPDFHHAEAFALRLEAPRSGC